MRSLRCYGWFVLGLLLARGAMAGQDFAEIAKTYLPRLESNLVHNIAGFWYPQTIDRTNGGYILNHDIDGRLKGEPVKMIVTQARTLWLFARLARAGYGGREYLDAADNGYQFLTTKMWDRKNGGFYWMVDATGRKILSPRKVLYGQSFALYALSEYYLASGKREALDSATELFNLLEAKAHDGTCGGYLESFEEDWTPMAPGEETSMGVPSEFKLMNTHLHLLESMTSFFRASRLPLARERLLELIAIQSNAVVRKGLGACTDKYRRDWEPVLTGDFARVSYGHDLENIWLLIDACAAAGVSTCPLIDLYRALFDYSLQYGFDQAQGGFFYHGPFNRPAENLEKSWWVQAEASVSALSMYRLTHESKYLEVFLKTYDWIDQHQTDWKHGEWHDTVLPDGTPRGDKAHIWKSGYHNGRAMIECLRLLKAETETAKDEGGAHSPGREPRSASASEKQTPVILDTDIGDDIDDTWALGLLLKSPELDLKLVVTDYGKVNYRPRVVAKFLEGAGRTDVAVGVGLDAGAQGEGGQAQWIKGYNLQAYPGKVYSDGVQALIDFIMKSDPSVILIAIGPAPNIGEALRREPRIAEKARFVGMYGSVRIGYGGAKTPVAEWNVKADPKACRQVFTAPWDMFITPLDTCGLIVLKGDRYARVRNSQDPIAKMVIENYRTWTASRNKGDASGADKQSSTLFDCVAVYLACSQEFCQVEKLGLRVTDDGFTRIDDTAKVVSAATAWKDQGAFEDFLVRRLTSR